MRHSQRAATSKVMLVAGWGKGRERKDYLHPPLGIYRIKSCLEEEGIECDVFDPNLSRDPFTELGRIVEDGGFGLVGFSSNHYTLPFDLALAHHLDRELGEELTLVGGGISNTENYEQILRYAPRGFIAVRGEGEITLAELCRGGDLSEVDGLAWLEGGQVFLTSPRKPLERKQFFRVLEQTRWEDIPFEKYWRFILESHDPSILIEQNINTVRLIVSNYCPLGCRFCSYTNFYKLSGYTIPQNVYRLPPESIVSIMERLLRAHPDVMNFFFHDDDFLASASWINELSDIIAAYRKAGVIPDYVTFMAQGSVRNIPRVAEGLSRASFRLIGLGVESFSPRVLEEFNKPHDLRRASAALEALFETGIVPYVNLILSSPGSRIEDLVTTVAETCKLLNKGAQVATSLYTLAFPGAEMTGTSERDGLVTYQDRPIEGTELVMSMTDKIVPRDARLRKVLERAESYASELETEFFSGEGAFRSLVAPLSLMAVSRALEESGVGLPSELRREMEVLRDSYLTGP